MLMKARPTVGDTPRASETAQMISCESEPQTDEVARDLRPEVVLVWRRCLEGCDKLVAERLPLYEVDES